MIELEKRVKLEAIKTLKYAMSSHEAHNWEEADKLYETVLPVIPENANAWALYGLLKFQQGSKPKAKKLFIKALSVQKDQPIALSFFSQLDSGGDLEEYCPNKITEEFLPKHDLFEINNLSSEMAVIDKDKGSEINQLSSNRAKLNLQKCICLEAQGRLLEALALLAEAVEFEPESPYLRFRYGNLLGHLGRFEDSISQLTEVIKQNPLYGPVYNDRAAIYYKAGKIDNAFNDIEKAAKLLPQNAQVYRNRGYILMSKRRIPEAAESYSKSLKIDPSSGQTFNNLGMSVEAMGRLDEAKAFYDKAIKIDSSLNLALWNKGLVCLRQGNFKDGWPLFEKRWNTEMAAKERAYPYPVWDGKKTLTGKTILLHSEQGLGDVIQFCRFVKDIEKKGARVILEVRKTLVSLLSSMTSSIKVVDHVAGLNQEYGEPVDLRCPLMSLPAVLQVNIEDLSSKPYIRADQEMASFFTKKFLEKKSPRIGIAWSGRAAHKNDHNRSISLLALSKLFSIDFEFHSLQVEYRDEDREKLKDFTNLVDHSDVIKDFSDTAALIDSMDLVISVDTSVAHLAGAMGKPTFLLLPFWPDWRWMVDRTDSPWYRSMKLFRQQKFARNPEEDPWSDVLDKVSIAISAFFSKKESLTQAIGKEYVGSRIKITDQKIVSELKKVLKLFSDGKLEKARKQAILLQKRFPNEVELIKLIANICFEQKKISEAYRYCEMALSLGGRQEDTLNLMGLCQERIGATEDAFILYDKAIKVSPDFNESYVNKGNLLFRRKQYKQARECYSKAVSVNPSDSDALYNLANTNHQLGNLEDALSIYSKSLEIDQTNDGAYTNRAAILRQMGRGLEALENYDLALRLDSGKVALLYERAMLLIELGRMEEAKLDIDRFIEKSPNNSDTFQKHAHLLMTLGKNEEAMLTIKRALEHDASNPECHHTYARLSAAMEKWEEAAISYGRAIKLNPTRAVFYANRSGALVEMGDPHGALADCNKGLDLFGRHPEILMNKGIALDALCRVDEASLAYEEAVKLKPNHALTRFNKAFLDLREGRLKEGFKGYEWRWQTESFVKSEKKYPYPIWDGKSSLKCKSIFVYHEQGFGDTIQFCRYLKFLVPIAKKVILGVPSSLVDFVSSLKLNCKVVATATPVQQIDVSVPLMSLPYLFGTSLETIPKSDSYLYVANEKKDVWLKRLGKKTKKRIGLVCSGRSKHKNDKNRSMSLETFTPLFDLDLDFHLIQKEIREKDENFLSKNSFISNHGDDLETFSDTAALVDQMDYLVTVDTSVAHVAAAIGSSVWILLPFRPDWRWLIDRDDSPWYPTVRLFRQDSTLNWSSVIDSVRKSLIKELAEINEGIK